MAQVRLSVVKSLHLCVATFLSEFWHLWALISTIYDVFARLIAAHLLDNTFLGQLAFVRHGVEIASRSR